MYKVIQTEMLCIPWLIIYD